MTEPRGKQLGPQKLDEVLGQLIGERGYAHQVDSDARQQAWQKAVGDELDGLTRAGRLYRGTLEVTVVSSVLIQELTFRKPALIEILQKEVSEHHIRDLKFRVGSLAGIE